MSRKRPLIPAFPIESRLLSLILGVVGVVLLVTGWWQDSNEMMVLGGLSLAGALIAVVADLLLGTIEDDE